VIQYGSGSGSGSATGDRLQAGDLFWPTVMQYGSGSATGIAEVTAIKVAKAMILVKCMLTVSEVRSCRVMNFGMSRNSRGHSHQSGKSDDFSEVHVDGE